MNDQHLQRLETQLERLTEGIFAYFFGKRIHAHDIALQLSRALEDAAHPPQAGNPHPIAPNHYTISVHPDVQQQIQKNYPRLPQTLTQQIIELTHNTGYQLINEPYVQFSPDANLSIGEISIQAEHITVRKNTTQVMKAINPVTSHSQPLNPQLILNAPVQKSIPLDKPLITLGRSHENDIVLDDAHISRFHAQIRLRFGQYTLFDTDSNGGTFVNDVRIQEHQLQSGDVIRIGGTTFVYTQDDTPDLHQTSAFESI